MNLGPGCDQIWTDSNINQVHVEIQQAVRHRSDIKLCLVDAYAGAITEGMNWLITDNLIKGAEYLSLLPEFFGHYHYDAAIVHRAPSKLFNCFMNRACPFRQSWLYQFQKRNLMDHGFISYNLDYRAEDLRHLAGTPALFRSLYDQGLGIFSDEHTTLANRVPYSNVTESLEQTIIDSKISVVIETYFDPDHIIALSEKIFRALQLPRPFLVFSATGTLKLLKDLGFDIYDDIVDQSYDLEPNSITRQMAILQQLEFMHTVCYSDSLQQDFLSRAQNNKDVLLQLKSNWPKKFRDILKRIEQR